jgi:tetratricopeptide (TPR) repeat protein
VLTDKDSIVLADFRNETGDAVFDDTLRQGLAASLEQSPVLSLVSEERVRHSLRLMGEPADARLTPAVARDICVRTASAAVVEGSIRSLGSQYVLGLRATSCRTDNVLDNEQEIASGKEHVLDAVHRMAGRFRTRGGESRAGVSEHSTPLEEATTPSLDALQAYTAAMKVEMTTSDLAAAVPLFKRAIDIDPKFAMAHAFLGRTYADLGEPVLSAESTRRAFELRARASEAERFFIDTSYDLQVTGNLERAHTTLTAWIQAYPRDPKPPTLLSAFVYQPLGNYERAIEGAQRGIDLDPDFFPGHVNLAGCYLYVGRIADAERVVEAAAERKLESPFLVQVRFQIAFLEGDAAARQRQVDASRGNPGVEGWIDDLEALTLAYEGRVQEARALSRHIVDLSKQSGQHETAALFEVAGALREAWLGNAVDARRGAQAALDLSKGRDVEYGAAFAIALAGDEARARALAADLDRRFPEDTEVRFAYGPALRAVIALSPAHPDRGDPAAAIRSLEVARPYELGIPQSAVGGFYGALYPIYLRGMAHLAAGHAAAAAAEFRRVLDHPGIVSNDPIGALSRLQLGRALALAGDPVGARTAYKDLLGLWRGADRDLPVVVRANAEYARLR